MEDVLSYTIKAGKEAMQPEEIYLLLKDTHWARNRSKECVKRSLEESVCIGAFEPNGRQIGFARAITDSVTVYYVLDVVVHPDFRCRGVGRSMIEALLSQPRIHGLRGILITRNPHAQVMYEKLGFSVRDTVFMELPAVREGLI